MKVPDLSGFQERGDPGDHLLDESGNLNLSEFLGPKTHTPSLAKSPIRKGEGRSTLLNQKGAQSKRTEIANRVDASAHVPVHPRSQSIHAKSPGPKTLKPVHSTRDLKVDDSMKTVATNFRKALAKGDIDPEAAKQSLRQLLEEVEGLMSDRQSLPLKGNRTEVLARAQTSLFQYNRAAETKATEVRHLDDEISRLEFEGQKVEARLKDLGLQRQEMLSKITDLEKNLERKLKEEKLGKFEIQEMGKRVRNLELKGEVRPLASQTNFFSRKTTRLRNEEDLSIGSMSRPKLTERSESPMVHSERVGFLEAIGSGAQTKRKETSDRKGEISLRKSTLESSFSKLSNENIQLEVEMAKSTAANEAMAELIEAEKRLAESLQADLERSIQKGAQLRQKLSGLQVECQELLTRTGKQKSFVHSYGFALKQLESILEDLTAVAQSSSAGEQGSLQEIKAALQTVEEEVKKRMVFEKYSNFDAEVLQILRKKLEEWSTGKLERLLDFDEVAQKSAKSSSFILAFQEKMAQIAKIFGEMRADERVIRNKIRSLEGLHPTLTDASQRTLLDLPGTARSSLIQDNNSETLNLEAEGGPLTDSAEGKQVESRNDSGLKTALALYAEVVDANNETKNSSKGLPREFSIQTPTRVESQKSKQNSFFNHSVDLGAEVRRYQTQKAYSSSKAGSVPGEFVENLDVLIKELGKFINFIIKCSSNFANMLSFVVTKLPKEAVGTKNLRQLITVWAD